ncbi:MAG: hypothetical protein WC584_04200 [Candidatus Pacearchaeota archaeon]
MPEKSEDKKTETQKKISQSEFEKKIVELAEKGFTSEKIGEELRRQNIHPKEYPKKISQILKERKLYINPDLKNIERKLEKINKHYEKNKQDKRAIREKVRVFAQNRKLKHYFKVE